MRKNEHSSDFEGLANQEVSSLDHLPRNEKNGLDQWF